MFVEVVRLLITLTLTAVGFIAGESLPDVWPDAGADGAQAAVWGAVLGAGIGYVLGGVVGRRIRTALGGAPRVTASRSAPELFVGSFGLLIGVIVGAIATVPFVVLLPAAIGWPLGGLVVVLTASFGWRVLGARSSELSAWVGLEPKTTVDDAPTTHILDSSAAIDGRVVDMVRNGLVTGMLFVPGFVVDEMQALADAADAKVRRRGRRGLDNLDVMRRVDGVGFGVIDDTVPDVADVDAKLVTLAMARSATLITTDHNLAAAAELRGVRVLNPHAIAEALRPKVMTGDTLSLHIDRPGSEPGQGVGFLDDGTMVVVAGAAASVGETLDIEVANVVSTAVGRLVFASRA